MKTKITLFLLIFTSSIYSQIEIGVNAGTTYSKFNGTKLIENTDAGISFLIGASFEYSLNQSLSIKTNLNYERKSYNAKTSGFDEDGFPINEEWKITTHFDYLTKNCVKKQVIFNIFYKVFLRELSLRKF